MDQKYLKDNNNNPNNFYRNIITEIIKNKGKCTVRDIVNTILASDKFITIHEGVVTKDLMSGIGVVIKRMYNLGYVDREYLRDEGGTMNNRKVFHYHLTS